VAELQFGTCQDHDEAWCKLRVPFQCELEVIEELIWYSLPEY
jgi:hypothetical protein